MSANYDKLKEKLKEIFQLDQADLDFGIYRILNTKAEEVERYLDEDLKKQVVEILSSASTGDLDEVKKQISEIEQQAKKFKADPNDNPDYLELKERLAGSIDVDALEKEIFSDLYNFFSRYYEGGDFLSLRRYKEGVYAIPYEGEEVKLHWANSDQYYIKTSEYFANYSFRLADGKRIHFRLVKAGTEANNNKAQEGKDRRFILSSAEGVRIENEELVIPFEYRPDNGKRTQKVINEAIVETLRKDKTVIGFAPDLLKEIERTSGGSWTALEKYLNDYTAKNEFDYFIHKDLGGFMRRELDFFIKNEVLYLDDMIDQTPKDFEKRLSKLKALKTIGHKIIDFLAQLEEFQKKLWLKKKFVVETNWCITLDRVPEALYKDIAANDAQAGEWVKLFAIDELNGYGKKLSEKFLKDNPYLVLDTAFFSAEFKAKLLERIENIDEQTNGLLIQSDNFQALNLLLNKYRKSVECVYIDPPYNTVHSEIVYKNQFKHSTWLTLISNPLSIVEQLWTDKFSFGIAIDDYEHINLGILLKDQFSNYDYSTVVVNHHPQGSGGRLSRTHEYYILISPESSPQYLGKPKEDEKEERSFMRSGTGENNYRKGRWKSFYALLVDSKSNEIVGAEEPVALGEEYPTEPTKEGYIRKYPINSKGEERVWRSSYETGQKRAENAELTITASGAVYQTIDHQDKRETFFSNWVGSEFNAGTHGSALLTAMGLQNTFDYPKSINTMEAGLWAQTYGKNDAVILDYFAGSGTTGHAVINMNKEDGGERKYLLVEMGSYFDTATKPRIQKVIYSKDWKDGKPVSREGISQCFKYIRLESYEDALNNLTLERSDDAQGVLDKNEKIKEQYLLHYMLDTESKGSVLDLNAFAKPFDYQLMINRNDDMRARKIDLVETFNYLIGLYVEQMRFIDDVYVVSGKTREGEVVLILWRDAQDMGAAGLDKWFEDNRETLKPSEYSAIYVNGDSTLQGLAGKGDNWTVKLTEDAFHRLMFNETSL